MRVAAATQALRTLTPNASSARPRIDMAEAKKSPSTGCSRRSAIGRRRVRRISASHHVTGERAADHQHVEAWLSERDEVGRPAWRLRGSQHRVGLRFSSLHGRTPFTAVRSYDRAADAEEV